MTVVNNAGGWVTNSEENDTEADITQCKTVLLKAVRNRPDGTVRNRPDGTVRSRPDAARSRPNTARNSTVERSERNKSHTNYMLTTCSLPSFCHVEDEHGQNETNNVTSCCAQTYTTISCKT